MTKPNSGKWELFLRVRKRVMMGFGLSGGMVTRLSSAANDRQPQNFTPRLPLARQY